MRRFTGLAALVLALTLPTPARAALQFGVVSPNLKVRPADRPTLAPSAKLRAARNEVEPFQVVFLSSGGGTQGVEVKVTGPLAGPGGCSIPQKNVVLYVARYYGVGAPSSLEGAAGLWPDPLVPVVDTYFGEARPKLTFPLEVPDGQSRIVWVDILVPADAVPGPYTGRLEVLAAGAKLGEVPISLEVGSFSLPSTATLASAFGMSWSAPCLAHTGFDTCGSDWNEDRAGALSALYLRAGLEHRFTISDAAFQPPVGASVAPFEKHVLPLLDGKGPTRLAGARLTAISICGTPAQWIPYAKSKGFFDRTFYYPVDEPNDDAAAWSKFIAAAQSLHQVDSSARIIITSSIKDANAFSATSHVDIFCPVINELEDKAGQKNAGDQTATYQSWLLAKPNRRLWAYQSCMSHGCGECGETTGQYYFTGWPNRVIDSSAVQNRAFPWVAFRLGVTGELYFDATNQLSTAWEANGQCKYGGSGDGTIFYPGRPDIIGGTKHIPIESIRVKLIREGMEDYEYLVQAAKKDSAKARAIAAGLFSTAFGCAQSAEKLEQARSQLFDLLQGPARDGATRDSAGSLTEAGGAAADAGQGSDREGSSGSLGGGCGCGIQKNKEEGTGEQGALAFLVPVCLVLLLLCSLSSSRRRRRRKNL